MSSPSHSVTGNLARYVSNLATQAQSRPSMDQPEISLEEASSRLEIEKRLREGAENLLQVLDTRTRERPKEAREARRVQVMEELDQINLRISFLNDRIEAISSGTTPTKNSMRQRSDDLPNGRPKLPTIKSYASAKYSTVSDSSADFLIVDLIGSLAEQGHDAVWYISKANDLVHFLAQHKGARVDLSDTTFARSLCHLWCSSSSNTAACGFRIARYLIHDQASAKALLTLGIDLCLINALSKDHKYGAERTQAFRLLRSLYIFGTDVLTDGLLRALVSIAESDDKLKLIAVETLSELQLLCPALMAANSGYRCLLNSLVEGPPPMSNEMAMGFVYALDVPNTRQYLHPAGDLQTLFAPFTEYVEGKGASTIEDRIITSTTVVARMLNSWPGLLGLTMYDFQGIRSVMDALKIPRSLVRESILDFLFDTLCIPVNNMTSSFLAGRRLTTIGRMPISAGIAGAKPDSKAGRDVHSRKDNLLKQFSALKLLLFLDVGLLDALMVVIEDAKNPQAARKATWLIGEILQLCNTLLPLARCCMLQTLPRLFSTAADLRDMSRFYATSALYQIESLNRSRNKSVAAKMISTVESASQKRGQRQVEQVKMKMGLQIDDSHFRNLLLDTQVLSTKNYTKWHWDTLTELVQGPLLNPKRLEESIRATKFMKRLLAFYRPFTHRFSAIKNTKPNQKYVKFGSLLLNTLLANPEGIKYLTESKLLRQLSECLAQMDPVNHVTASDALFSKTRLAETLCHGYFELIGTLTAHTQGVAMLERWRMFSSLYHLTDLRSRGDLVTLFLYNMDYNYEGHPRVILSKALTTGLLDVRLFATEHLGSLIAQSENNTRKTSDWAIRLLITQLYDPHTEVCAAAVRVLEDACNAREHLEYVVELRPALDHLGEIGGPLLLRFLATSIGFHYLKELDYIDREMDDWFHGRNDEYVTHVEAILLQTLSPISSPIVTTPEDRMPAHFYGELARTAEGVELLLEKGHFAKYVEVIQTFWLEESSLEIIHKVKAALWAVGNIGATERGAPFLKDSQVLKSIVGIAENSLVGTLKGTAYLVLGMLSSTRVGSNLLESHEWSSVMTNMGDPIGVCVPTNIRDVLNLKPWKCTNSIVSTQRKTSASFDDPLGTEIVHALADLSNHILANEAAKTLIRLKQRYPTNFTNLALYDHVHHLLSSYNYRLAVRKFMLELFSTETLESYLLRRLNPGKPTRGYSLPQELSTAGSGKNSGGDSSGPDVSALIKQEERQGVKSLARSQRSATVGGYI